jgi:hypothetical protein
VRVQGTGTLIKKLGPYTYQMLTSAYLVKPYIDGKLQLFDSANFMLNRIHKTYVRRFKLLKESVKIFGGCDESYPSSQGGEFALVNV